MAAYFGLLAGFLVLLYSFEFASGAVRLKAGENHTVTPHYGSTGGGAASSPQLHLTIFCRAGQNARLRDSFRTASLKLSPLKSSLHGLGESERLEVFEGATAQVVQDHYDAKTKSWSMAAMWFVVYGRVGGPMSALSQGRVAVNVFNESCVGVASQHLTYSAVLEEKAFDLFYFGCAILSAFVFFSAHKLSKNALFYYSSGTAVGILGSILVLGFFLSRYIPKRGFYAWMVVSASSFFAALKYLWEQQLMRLLEEHYQLTCAYVGAMGCLSFAFLYWRGPVTGERTHSLIQWAMQVATLALLSWSIQVKQVAMAVCVSMVIVYNVPQHICNPFLSWWRKTFPPKVRLLTEEEYDEETRVCTEEALKELQGYCKSPDCNTWKLISSLKQPNRFAQFVDGNYHLNDQELLGLGDWDSDLSNLSNGNPTHSNHRDNQNAPGNHGDGIVPPYRLNYMTDSESDGDGDNGDPDLDRLSLNDRSSRIGH